MDVALRTLATIACVTGFSWLTVSSGSPTLWAPGNILVLLPVWIAGSTIGLAFVPILCVAWCIPVFRGAANVPNRSLVLVVLAIALSITYLVTSADYGVRWQGTDHVTGVAIISISLWIGLLLLAWWAWRRRTQALNAIFHATLFCWLAWYAFPTLGELP